ncbi:MULTISPECIES: sensor histidine kinase [unclassified Streptomyces]|uniref:sensor histidine kinase n=1 Tax=unclassified Streptomyces TaxID=2593676 RepID=UPI002E820804|nr:sensor histidine kinase [Streptomyces sp. NBC_00589]WTI42790.1 sensor histidine kinase [Streptomyces sp. NBC_00775]WUB32993.1 sensor histidine kinase [Streptomyces sp. NBC_00589]
MLHLTGFAHRGTVDPARALRQDALLAAVLLVVDVTVALTVGADGRRPDALGWTLLIAAHLPLVWRRRAPLTAFLALVAFAGPYHALDFNHTAPLAASMLALFTVAVTGRPLRSLLVGSGVIGLMLTVKFAKGAAEGAEALRVAGWIVAFIVLGVYVRVHGQYVASVVERAERAERTREEEARRRVAEERLRIARDLHDLLAHTITLIGVQTSVAAHVLAADPDRLDREAVARALDDISETCRTARGEVRSTLEVLRAPEYGGDGRGPLPGLDGLSDLVTAARTAGAKVETEIAVPTAGVPSAVGAAAHRIVQEALTNAVRHAGPEVTVRVALRADDWALRVTVTDDGVGDAGGPPGFGLVGMRERARSVGGTLEAGVREGGGFGVSAVLPLVGPGPVAVTVPMQADARDLDPVRDDEAVRAPELERGEPR